MRSRIVGFMAAVGMLIAAPVEASAQARDAVQEEVRWFFGFPSWTFTLYGGFATQSSFLLQALDGPDGVVPQRRLEADASFSYGGAIGVTFLPRTSARLAFTRTSADLDYENDSGTGSNVFSVSDVADLSTNILSLEVLRFLLPDRIKLTPYGGLGVAVAWWDLDPNGAPFILDGGTETRWGGVAILGMQYRPDPRWAIRVEGTGFALGNPFTGNDSFVPLTGFTIDEPEKVGQKHFRLSVAYTFASPERPDRVRRGR